MYKKLLFALIILFIFLMLYSMNSGQFSFQFLNLTTLNLILLVPFLFICFWEYLTYKSVIDLVYIPLGIIALILTVFGNEDIMIRESFIPLFGIYAIFIFITELIMILFYFQIRLKKFKRLLKANDYAAIIEFGKNLKVLHRDKIKPLNQYFCYNIALKSLDNGNYENFDYYINKVSTSQLISSKYFMLAMYYYQLNNEEKWLDYYHLFIKNPTRNNSLEWNARYKLHSLFLNEVMNFSRNEIVNTAILKTFAFKTNSMFMNKLIADILTQYQNHHAE